MNRRGAEKNGIEENFSFFLPLSAPLRLCGLIEIYANENEPPKDRKLLDDRGKMTELERIRHSAAQASGSSISRK